MAALPTTPSVLNRLSLTEYRQKIPQGYYRSKLFIAPFTTNPIVAAAGPVLSLLERICVTQTLPAISSIRDNLDHELHAFLSRLSGQSPVEEFNVIAYYLLCAAVDEILGKNYLRVHGELAPFTAFTPPSPPSEPGPEEYFFKIIHFIKEKPNQYLDLIELAYYCLIAGFEGKYHGQSDGRMNLDNLLEELFQLIQQYRVNKTERLFKKPIPVESIQKNNKPLLGLCIISVSVLISGFLLSHLLLENKAQTLQIGHQMIAKLDD
ncbi:MAG: type IV secretion protein DotU [Legionellales bacterium RIFCSPHIGHO2_12_FULL_42_9]|nr:MAG: type IV secretion protein DotU [Legionellales bacterium RIFCSPHIGHO2_12_FULL_42_9]